MTQKYSTRNEKNTVKTLRHFCKFEGEKEDFENLPKLHLSKLLRRSVLCKYEETRRTTIETNKFQKHQIRNSKPDVFPLKKG